MDKCNIVSEPVTHVIRKYTTMPLNLACKNFLLHRERRLWQTRPICQRTCIFTAKPNNVVSERDVKIYFIIYEKWTNIFVANMWVAFALQKQSTFNIYSSLNKCVKLIIAWTTGPWMLLWTLSIIPDFKRILSNANSIGSQREFTRYILFNNVVLE